MVMHQRDVIVPSESRVLPFGNDESRADDAILWAPSVPCHMGRDDGYSVGCFYIVYELSHVAAPSHECVIQEMIGE